MAFARTAVLACAVCLLTPLAAGAQAPCRFSESGLVMRLMADCVTDQSIEIPDGFTLDGDGHEILAVDPAGHAFRGAIVVARGVRASIIHTTVTAAMLAGECPTSEHRLRGIYFDGASGEIRDNRVIGVFRAPLSCEEGNAIEVRNRQIDGLPASVVIARNGVLDYQKTGIVVYGNVDALIHDNFIGASVVDGELGVNGVQVGPTAGAQIERNTIRGIFTGHVTAGSAIILVNTRVGTLVEANQIISSADVGIYIGADAVTVAKNHIEDVGEDGLYDVAVVNRGADNLLSDNTVRGFRVVYFGAEEPARVPSPGQQIEE